MARFGHLATRMQMRELGHTSLQLQRAVAEELVWPIGRSWLANRGAEHAAMRAVALHGRLTASFAAYRTADDRALCRDAPTVSPAVHPA